MKIPTAARKNMIEEFPKLKGLQVALSCADYNTGHVLDVNLELAISPMQRVFTIFNHVVEAKEKAIAIVKSNKNIECYIHGANAVLISYIDQTHI